MDAPPQAAARSTIAIAATRCVARRLPPTIISGRDSTIIVMGALLRRVIAVLLALGMVGCGGDKPVAKRAATAQGPAHRVEDSAAGQIDLGGSAYHPGTLSAAGA